MTFLTINEDWIRTAEEGPQAWTAQQMADFRELVLSLKRLHVLEPDLAERLTGFGMESIGLNQFAGTDDCQQEHYFIRATIHAESLAVSSSVHNYQQLIWALEATKKLTTPANR